MTNSVATVIAYAPKICRELPLVCTLVVHVPVPDWIWRHRAYGEI